MRASNVLFRMTVAALLSACASTGKQVPPDPFDAISDLLDHSADYSQQEVIHQLYLARSWVPYKQLHEDPIALSKRSAAPINQARTKILGPSYQDSIRSLAAKLWMIEHAEHTLDLTYYIFSYDPVGYAILGALCDAVRRGVDIRIMVDSLGSFHTSHAAIRALETCADEAGYMRDANGEETPYKARVQFVVINALTSVSSWANRRSHDKLIIKDGNFPGRDMVMTGGRNISVDYYGIKKDGSRNPDTYLDLEMILRSADHVRSPEAPLTVGDVTSIYYSLLFMHKGNQRVYPERYEDDEDTFSLFIAQYEDEEGNVFFDGAKEMLKTLDEYPGVSFEIVTSSVLTSDNFFTQSVIDMDTAPRLLLTPEIQRIWLSSSKDSELNPEFLGSEQWKRLIDHPRIRIYEVGRLDSILLGGTHNYGKLHAKFFFDDEFGFVGTSNFDYRSRLYNNEMGFYYLNAKLSHDLNEMFEELKGISLRWGSVEWLEMRQRLIASGGFKGFTTSHQRGLYKLLKGTGLIWLM